MNYISAAAVMVFGTLLMSSKAIVIKLAYLEGIEVLPLMTLRMLAAVPFYLLMLVYLLLKQGKPQSSFAHLAITLFLGILLYHIGSLLDLSGLQYVTASLERLILYSFPCFVLLINFFVFKQRVKTRHIVALITVYLGIVAMVYQDFQLDGSDIVYGSFLILCAALCTAFFMIGSAHLGKKMGSLYFTTLAMLASCFTLLMHFLHQQDLTELLGYSWTIYGYALYLGLFCTVIAVYLMNAGMKILGANNGSIISAAGPVFTALLAVFALDEHFTMIHLIGLFCVILGMLLLSNFKLRSN